MKANSFLAGLFLLAIFSFSPPTTAEEVTVDLALSGETVVTARGSELTFRLVNLLPGRSYSVSVLRETEEAEPLSLGFFNGSGGAATPVAAPRGVDEAASPCPAALEALRTALGKAKSEAEVGGVVREAQGLAPAGCGDQIKALAEAHTTIPRTYGPCKLGRRQACVVTVKREAHATKEPKAERTWTFRYTTGGQSKWLAYYGYSFLPSEDERFFSKAVEDGEGFVITPQADRGSDDYEPTVLFAYIPEKFRNNAWVPKFTFGLGADLEETLVFVGAGWVIGDNVNLFVGVAGHKQERLKGIYEPGQELKEAITDLTDETFDTNIIFGVGIRFNGSPFKKKPGSSTSSGSSSGSGGGGGQGGS